MNLWNMLIFTVSQINHPFCPYLFMWPVVISFWWMFVPTFNRTFENSVYPWKKYVVQHKEMPLIITVLQSGIKAKGCKGVVRIHFGQSRCCNKVVCECVPMWLGMKILPRPAMEFRFSNNTFLVTSAFCITSGINRRYKDTEATGCGANWNIA